MSATMQGVVIFTNDADHWLASRLRPGYRHVLCFVPADYPGLGTVVNVTTGGVVVVPTQGDAASVARHYRQQGLEAWRVPYTPWKRQLLPMTLNSCVGVTKQVLGIQSWALTPWQLRQHLAKEFLDAYQYDPARAGAPTGSSASSSSPA